MTEASPRWLLLIHQIPPKPAYLRVKVGRRLQGLGAVPVKNSVYVLPRSEQALEDFHWVRAEIVAGGGDASVCEAGFLEGLSDQAVEALFNAARDADYAEVGKEIRTLQKSVAARARRPALGREQAASALARLRRRFEDVAAMDFFRAPGRNEVEALLAAVENALRPPSDTSPDQPPASVAPQAGPHLGDPQRRLRRPHRQRLADPPLHRPRGAVQVRARPCLQAAGGRGPLRHVRGRVHARRRSLHVRGAGAPLPAGDPALRHLAEIVHDIDLKDSKFSRPEAPGLEHLLSGIAMRHADDVARIDDGSAVFEGLYEYFRRKK